MFKLEFETKNAAFAEGGRAAEVARILREVSDKVEHTASHGAGPIFDSNGNRVGAWYLTP